MRWAKTNGRRHRAMSGRQRQLGWRAMTGLAFCGAATGFTVPAIASSLVQQEKREPAVRLLPAPRLPSSETDPTPSVAIPSAPPSVAQPSPLGMSKLEQKEFRRLQRSYRAAAKKDGLGASAPAAAPGYVPAPTTSPSPAPSSPPPAKQPEGREPKASAEGGRTGGVEGPQQSSSPPKQK
jgi:hypothetical protein